MPKIQRILCPTDFSPTALRACEYAADVAKSFGASLILVHVIPELNYPTRSFGMAMAFPNLQAELHKRAAEELTAAAKRIDPSVKVSTELRDGVAHDQILDCAKTQQVEMIVLGTHGHTGLSRLMLGSTAERVVRMSEIPVLTVRTKG